MTDTLDEQSIVTRNIEDEMRTSYLRYSMSVIISRALPDVRDGLKPSQRRILYAMRQLNLGPNSKFRKCAKISGDTSGDYHPHGEQVIYPTLVRLAQNWVMRYRLVDGQGNFGSIDGDPPAAMRYTEARLTEASMQLMADLDKETVDMTPNYDETKSEPVVFPAKFPNLLSNGSSGIAVGMATNIPPHNLRELIAATLLVLENPATTIEEILQVMPGPDFPTGGMICGYRGIREAYYSGRGKMLVRGEIRVDSMDESGDRQQLIIDSIPYNVNKSRLIDHIATLVNDKAIVGISDVRDESDKSGLRIVVELKRGQIPEVIINQLYKFTELQVTFGAIMLALDRGLPREMTVKEIIQAWIDHRIVVIRRRTEFELRKAEARAHVLEGYLKAIDMLDAVVRLIRASDNRDQAREGLITQFDFTERQANAVLDLRLYQLTSLEKNKIQDEYDALLEKIRWYRELLASEEKVRGVIGEELTAIQTAHGSPRLTQIVPAEGDMQYEDLIPNESVVITVSEDDYVKRMPIDTFREQRRGGQGVSGLQQKRETDSIKNLYVANTHEHLLLFTNLGRCYWLKVWQIPEGGRKSKGKPLINLLEDLQENERIAAVLRVGSLDEEGAIVLATRQGVIKKSALTLFSNPRRKGIIALSIDEGDELIGARLVKVGEQMMLFTKMGMAVRFDESQAREMGRTARGVRGVKLKDGSDGVVALEIVSGTETVLLVCENGFGKRSFVEDFRLTNRGASGVRSIVTSERNGLVVGAQCVEDSDGMVLMSNSGQTVRIRMRDVRVMGRSTQGVKLVQLREGDLLVAVQKLEAIEGEEEVEAEAGATGDQEINGFVIPEETAEDETEELFEEEPEEELEEEPIDDEEE
ncbi:MAG: DNA topoisomerase (ATP-hydrolyzing) subunit A [Chlamydiia bacterium]|nr:DNA topoisomerase (ATP-hydrolyzing) subunit A [Chlamydiia bacterium]